MCSIMSCNQIKLVWMYRIGGAEIIFHFDCSDSEFPNNWNIDDNSVRMCFAFLMSAFGQNTVFFKKINWMLKMWKEKKQFESNCCFVKMDLKPEKR